jgi:hypothetical protein
MLIEYILKINTGTRTDLEADASVGFKNGIYTLATGHSRGYCNCLDGSSFSDISQENMILKGGELSLAENVRIKIVSEDVISHVVQNEIKLVGCKASMFLRIETSPEDKEIFKEMLISECSQTDEVSFEITLEDSTFANAGQINLKMPQGFGGGAQLETSYGEECPLKIYKQDKQEAEGGAISQGFSRGEEGVSDPELESPPVHLGISLITFNGKPSFVKNFAVAEVAQAGQNLPAVLTLSPEVQFSGKLEGKYIEVCSGKGKGNSYIIKKVDSAYKNGKLCGRFTLDRPVSRDEILAISDTEHAGLQRMPVANSYMYFFGTNEVVGNSIPAYDKIKLSESSTENFSVFRFCEPSSLYAIAKMNDTEVVFSEDVREISAQIANDDGSFSDILVEAECMEENKNFAILRFPSVSNGKKIVSEIGKHQPRWSYDLADFNLFSPFKLGTLNTKMEYELIKYATAGSQVPSDAPGPQSVGYLVLNNNPIGLTHFCGVQASLYWRVDDLSSSGAYKIRPRFSFRLPRPYTLSARALLIDDAGNAIDVKNYNISEESSFHQADAEISLTKNEVSYFGDATYKQDDWDILADLQSLLTFELEPKARVKYIYLQLFFSFDFSFFQNANKILFFFSASPVACDREIDIDKIRIKGRSSLDMAQSDIVSTTADICQSFGVPTNKESFSATSLSVRNRFQPGSYSPSFIPFKHGDNFQDKLAEICRAANFSMFSDGSKLYAKYFFSDAKKWLIKPASVIKGSLEVRNVNLAATDWDFSANTWDGQKTLSLNANSLASFPGFEWFPESDNVLVSGTLDYEGYLDNEIQGFGVAMSTGNVEKLLVDNMYWVMFSQTGEKRLCRIVSLRIGSSTSYALFVNEDAERLPSSGLDYRSSVRIALLNQEGDWRTMVSGNLGIDRDSAKFLWEISRTAFEENKKRAKLDERYSKHQIAAFGDDSSWLKNFITTAEYNSFAKVIVSFKVPIDFLPEGSLSSLLLKRATLAFGRFRNDPLNGWIVGYSLIPSEDAVRIEFINSEPLESQFLLLDENLLNDQLTIDERNPTQNFYSEVEKWQHEQQ